MGNLTLEQVLNRCIKDQREIVNVDEPEIQLVVFKLAGQLFAFRGECIREILAHCEVFFVPGLPSALEGVINVRGDIESVMRLNELLHLPAPRIQANTILLGQGRTIRSGIRVDQVLDVLTVPQSGIQTPPEALPDHLRPYVLGLLHYAQVPVILLDLERLFTTVAGNGTN